MSKPESLLLRGSRVVLPDREAEGLAVLVEGGRLSRVAREAEVGGAGATRELDLSGLTLYPGFVDVHIHGAVGVDANDAAPEDLHRVARFLARNGVTTWLPTLVPDTEEAYGRAARAIGELMSAEGDLAPAASAAGVHYEGPFVNLKQCGALRTRFFRTYSGPRDLDALAVPPAAGAVLMMTLAPEMDGGIALVRELARRGWVVSVGHTRAGVETLSHALAAGARHMTHFPNAMSPLHHRDPGPVGWGLVTDEVTLDLIADGVHSDPLMLRLAIRCKTPARVSLISDSVAPAGLGDGEHRVWGETIRVEGGRTMNERGSIAGSVITMLDAVRTVTGLGHPLHEVARMASLNPARLVSLGRDRGSIEEGKRADLVALDAQGRARLTLVAGRVAHDAL